MLSKAKIKQINSLKMSKFRKQHGLFVAEGNTNVLDFFHDHLPHEGLYATEDWVSRHDNPQTAKHFTVVTDKEMKQISFLKNPSDILGVFRIPQTQPLKLDGCKDIILMLDDMRDPGNLGTIIRTADWFGIRHLVCSENSVDAFNPKVVQASMGSLARVNVHYENLVSLIESKPAYLKVYGAVIDGKDITKTDKSGMGILLIGNEAHGISYELLQLVDHRITIPKVASELPGSAESLNASIAAAIICHEFRR